MYDRGEILKRLLVEFKEDGVPRDLKEREIDISTGEKKASVLTGIRRAGKTYRMFQAIEEFGEEDSFYLNFEDERLLNPNIEDLSGLIPLILETFEVNKPIYLFVDEIQNVEGWEKWARRMAEREDVVIFCQDLLQSSPAGK